MSINAKLSDILAASTFAGSELMYVVQGGNSRRTTVSGIFSSVSPTFPDIRLLGAVDGGDATTAIQQGMDLYGTVFVPPGFSCIISDQIVVPAGGGLVCLDPSNRPTFLIDMTAFTNATRAGQLGATGCVFLSEGGTSSPFTPKEKVVFQNIRIIPNGYDGTVGTIPTARRTTLIAARNVRDVVITGCEIAGFCVGTAIMLDSCLRPIRITENYIHDWYSNDVWPDAQTSQTTGVMVDDGRINSVGTTEFQIDDNTIRNLEKGAITYGTWGVQTDAINLNGANGGYGTASNNVIYNVDEGIDCFMQGVTISGNNIRLTHGAGVKIIHGGSKNNISDNTILDARGWGMSITSSVNGAVEDNHVTGNYVEATGGTLNPALTTTACLSIGEDTNVCRLNYFAGNTWVSDGSDYVCKNNNFLGTGSENFSTGDEWRGPGGTGWFNDTNTLLICQKPVDPTVIKATLASNLTKNAAGTSDVIFDSEITDKRGEWNTTTGEFTAQLPGRYDVSLKMFTQSLPAATLRLILKLQNLSATDQAQGIAQTSGSVAAQPKITEFGILLGSGEGLQCQIQLEANPGGNVVFNATASQTAIEIKAS